MATTKIIQSIERAMSILELFQNNVVELSLKDISDKLDLNKSTAFGLVNSLSALGYLLQNEDNQKYCLGPKILSLSNALKMNNVLIRIAHPFLEQLSHKYYETVHSAVQSDNSVIYLDKVESDSSIFINTQMGIKNYMYCTGVGKSLLSYKTETQIDQLLTFPLKALTYNTITKREALLDELKLSRERGYSMDNEEIEIGLTCVGLPVFKGYEDPGFAISISGASGRILDKLHNTDLIQDMKAAAAALSWQIYNYQVPPGNPRQVG